MTWFIYLVFSKDVNCTTYLLLSYWYHQLRNMTDHLDFASHVTLYWPISYTSVLYKHCVFWSFCILFILSCKICDFKRILLFCFMNFTLIWNTKKLLNCTDCQFVFVSVTYIFISDKFVYCHAFFSCQSLTLLEYLLKTGDDRVLLKMKDSIYIVKALTEYRFIEKDGKDQVILLVSI